MKTLVIGASHKPERYSYKAVKLLQQYDHEVIALGRKARKVEDWEIIEGKPDLKDIDTVTLYLSAANQEEYYDYLKDMHPRRVIFNPGAENRELARILKENGIKTEESCTLVLLGTGQF
ncbi:MAG: CoA-binding protein [Owenweeksia sp.]|nr:CoA-binding protein [Owenweeksia sp.]MBF97921.1 CoA-binding protein [Owenweeksia sp.]HBF19406.1 CoA-binding protein [Cryomorphaceae bacterium]HCQ14873.1 CoA-binding protein [Cryomorphaceae bacterium]|tara:strand:- start:190 stop:546 length:357 start_codon:yes stop_codon:yes gene_type:complete